MGGRDGAADKHNLAHQKASREENGQQSSNSLLYEAALATERTLWTVKVAQRPKSFGIPSEHCTMLQPSKSFPPQLDFSCSTSVGARRGESQISEPPTETSPFF